MNSGFWDKLTKPFFVLAPLANVTDAAFRRIIVKYSKGKMGDVRRHPFVMYTEFVSADGLVLAPEEGRKKLLADLMYDELERPIVAQFFSGKPDMMEKAARLARELGFDGVDINMGCPDRAIEKQGAGAAHIKNPKLAQEIIYAAMEGAGPLPVSVKTRLGYNKDELEEWLPVLLETKLAAVIIHARTRKEMSKVPARWERIARAVEIRNEFSKGEAFGKFEGKTLIIGNGDLENLEDARARVAESGADGAMLGRAIFGNPWLFSNSQEYENRLDPVVLKKNLSIMVEHTKLFEEILPHKSFALMKKHYKAYVAGFEGASALRAELMEAENASEVERIVQRFCATL